LFRVQTHLHEEAERHVQVARERAGFVFNPIRAKSPGDG
jgi:hypothetical protein